MTARVYEHGAFESERRLQLLEAREWRVGRRVRAIGCVRVTIARSEDVTVRVARERRRPIARRACVRIGRFAGWDLGHLASRSYRGDPVLTNVRRRICKFLSRAWTFWTRQRVRRIQEYS